MKKAKIALTAITVLAIVGGALAFKTKGTTAVYSCNTTTNKCTVLADPSFLINPNGGAFNVTSVFNAQCNAQQLCGPTNGFTGN